VVLYYLDDNIDQIVFLDVDDLQVLCKKTFELRLYELINHKLDLSGFDQAYKNKNVGRKAYSPALLLRVIKQWSGTQKDLRETKDVADRASICQHHIKRRSQ